MSHWVKYTNNAFENTDINLLEKAIRTMNYGINRQCKHIQNAWGNENVDFALTDNKDRIISLGFRADKNNTLELVGDFFATGLREDTFLNQLAQYYQKERITQALEDNRWSIDSIETNQNNEIVINAYQYTL